MCKFKSGIILKNRIVLAQGADSHTKLLKELGMKDSTENAITKFVRAELVPPRGEWWTDPDTWKFVVDQDIVPEWFNLDHKRYEDEFRAEVKDWCKEHVLVDQEIEELSGGYYRLKRCRVGKLLKDARVRCDESGIQSMHDHSVVECMLCGSVVWEMHNHSIVERMFDSSAVKKMYDRSAVKCMYGNSVVKSMRGNSIVEKMSDDSIVERMYDDSIVERMCGKSVVRARNL